MKKIYKVTGCHQKTDLLVGVRGLTYIHDESCRRSTLLQLNLGEGRHSLARSVFHGKGGELHQRYREGQEDHLGALGLVLNIIVLKEHHLYVCSLGSITNGRFSCKR